jgi:archaemetzincin
MPMMLATLVLARVVELAALEPTPAHRGEVVLVALGDVDADLLDAVEHALRERLQVEVRRIGELPLPRSAYYKPRKRWRADVLLDVLLTHIPGAPPTTRILGLTASDISTTKAPHADWGIFGLGYAPGQAAVVSSFRLARKAKDRAQVRARVASTAVHEVGHTFGLQHCTEPRCPMQDAEGGIANTDAALPDLGPECRTELEAAFPVLD